MLKFPLPPIILIFISVWPSMRWPGAKLDGGKVSFKGSYCTSTGDYGRAKFPSEKPGAVL